MFDLYSNLKSRKRIITLLTGGFALAACGPSAPTLLSHTTDPLGCEDYQAEVTEGGVLYNNVWNKGAAGSFDWTQCLERKSEGDTSTYGWSWNWPNTGRQIFGYPQIKVGTSPWDPLPKFDRRFPVQLDRIDALQISHNLNIDWEGEFNIATSLWLTHTPDIGVSPNPEIIAAEVMVWSFQTPGHMRPAGRKVGTIDQDGMSWSIWVDERWGDASKQNSNRWIYLAFQAEKPSMIATFDAALLMRSPVLQDLGLEQFYVADIELGTEIMRGSGLAWVNEFEVNLIERTSNSD
jgi:hypothetical protein